MVTAIIIFIIGSAILGSIIEGIGGSVYDDDCPYCGGGDTDGNHCYTCEDDF